MAVAWIALIALAAQAAPTDKKEKVAGPLVGLPGAAGPHLAKVRALKDGEWVNLGSPAPDPKWGHARGRSWSCKMPYAPDLQGAFLHGQGVHGYIKPDGYFMDDIWFYDLNGHRWICLYPGTDTKTFVEKVKKGDLKVRDDGQLADKIGIAVPFSSIPGHSYQAHTYDTDLHRYIFGFGLPGVGNEQHVRDQPWCKEGTGLLRQQGKADRVMGTPYFYNTRAGKFERYPAEGGKSMAPWKLCVLFYLPTRKALWYYSEGTTLLCDVATRKWSDAGASGTTPPGTPDVGACYDSKRDRLYLGRGPYGPPARQDEGHVFIYDVRTNTWSNPPNQANAAAFPATNYGSVHYDAANDRVVVVRNWNGKGEVCVYDPQTGAWEAPGALPQPVISGGCWHGFYSPEVNAHFFYMAGDSDDRGTMWAYRLRLPRK